MGRVKEFEDYRKHEEESKKIVKRLLKGKISKEKLERIAYIVGIHMEREFIAKSDDIEAKMLMDSDILSDLGIYAFLRPFLYGVEKRKNVCEILNYLKSCGKFKLNRIKLNFKESKIIARKEIGMYNSLYSKILETIKQC